MLELGPKLKPLDCPALTAQIGRSRCLYSTSPEAYFALLHAVRCTSISTVKDSVADVAEEALKEYRRKRDFKQTPEPSGDPSGRADADRSAWDLLPHGHRFCVQKHRATRMHFDFRLEHQGVLLSWAVPRGPSLDPAKKRLAVQTEDHPIDYGEFEGVIPSGYGAGTVMLWDIGTFEWIKESAEDYERSRIKGDIKFRLSGSKLSGEFALVHIGERGRQYGGSSDGTKNWLMLKKRDASVVEGFEAIDRDVSVKTGRSLAEIASAGGGDPREMKRARDRGETIPSAPMAPATEPARAPTPMLATSADRPFSREGWVFELKYDGIRAMVSVAGDAVRITGRRGNDETAHYPEAQAIRAGIRARQAVVDGELVVLDADGRPSFERLQQRINARESDARRLAAEHPVTFVAFDLLQLEGRDLMSTELRIRKKTLRETIVDAPHILFAEHVERDGVALFDEARKSGIEGIVAKRADSLYRPGVRTPEWVKIKSWRSHSCVIAGYTAGRGRRSNQLGALILAIQQDGRLVHCGQVGTGFNDKMLRELKTQLAPLIVDKCQLDKTPKTTEPATWVQPELICEVRFSEWTNEGMLRHPAFQKLRTDQTREDTRRETPRKDSTRETTQALKAESREGKTGNAASVQNARSPDDSGNERIPAAQSLRHSTECRRVTATSPATSHRNGSARSRNGFSKGESGWLGGEQHRRSAWRQGCVALQKHRQPTGDQARRR